MEHRRISLVGPTLLVGVGVILLLNNLGYLNWGFWDILQLWPILLIAAGLEILLGHRSIWASVVAAVIVLALLVGGVLLVGRGTGAVTGAGEQVDISYPRDGASSATIVLEPAVTSLSIDALIDAPELVAGTVRVRRDERLDERFTGGDHAELVLASQSIGPRSFVGPARYAAWDLALNPDVSLDLSVQLAVGQAEVDLTRLTIEQANVSIGVGQVEVTLPATGASDIDISGGVGTLRINIPEGLGVRIITEAALVTHDLPSDFLRTDNVYTSPGYDRADHRATVTVGLEVGTITVRHVAGN